MEHVTRQMTDDLSDVYREWSTSFRDWLRTAIAIIGCPLAFKHVTIARLGKGAPAADGISRDVTSKWPMARSDPTKAIASTDPRLQMCQELSHNLLARCHATPIALETLGPVIGPGMHDPGR